MSYFAILARPHQPVSPSTLPQGCSNTGAFYRNHGKRIADLGILLLVAPIILAVVGILALVIAFKGHRPFYSQMRVGRNGRLFRLWKLRTMVEDADVVLQQHLRDNPAAAAEWQHTQKLIDDPRITSVGRFLRKSSLDELPQFFNVLRGEMSIVGPRPMLPEQREMYSSPDYYRMAPGVTGPWQVSARNTASFAARAHFDSSYNQNLSLREDLRLMVRTLSVVVACTGL